MMDRTSQFQVRIQEQGSRLVWRFPSTTSEGRQGLTPVAAALGVEIPKTITVGYYIQIDDPPDAWVFMPTATPWALAALGVPSVQRRIMRDLVERVSARSAEDGAS